MNCNSLKVLSLTILAGAFSLIGLSELENVNGQQINLTNASSNTNFTKLFQDKYLRNQTSLAVLETFGEELATAALQDVVVIYESPTTILISGDLITPFERSFNSYLWEAMDMLTGQYGFKLQQVMTSGVGSEGNPTVVYILMTK